MDALNNLIRSSKKFEEIQQWYQILASNILVSSSLISTRLSSFILILGFEPKLLTENEAVNEQVAFLKLGDLIIDAYGNKDSEKKKSIAINNISLDMKNVEVLYEEMCKEGYNINIV